MVKKKKSNRTLIRNFLIEAGVYGVLLLVYFLLVLRLLGEPLRSLFENNLGLYAVVCLGLIVAQGVLLDFVVNYILSAFGFYQSK